jgi:hypothetical protein
VTKGITPDQAKQLLSLAGNDLHALASVRNIGHYMNLSGSKDCDIAVIPKCGHAPVNIETKRMIRIDNLTKRKYYRNEKIKCVLSAAF